MAPTSPPERQCDADRDEPDVQSAAGADHDPADQVAAELVGAERVRGRGSGELHREVEGVGLVGEPQEAERSGDQNQSDQDGAGEEVEVAGHV